MCLIWSTVKELSNKVILYDTYGQPKGGKNKFQENVKDEGRHAIGRGRERTLGWNKTLDEGESDSKTGSASLPPLVCVSVCTCVVCVWWGAICSFFRKSFPPPLYYTLYTLTYTRSSHVGFVVAVVVGLLGRRRHVSKLWMAHQTTRWRYLIDWISLHDAYHINGQTGRQMRHLKNESLNHGKSWCNVSSMLAFVLTMTQVSTNGGGVVGGVGSVTSPPDVLIYPTPH